ncbi:hypothetical protein PFAG_04659 [Plasmodium falciparum Santa Lucia]|uniref:Uncharacterized protein n=10 Tax=Plasmodium falciparum TaxID=5833 RepID=W7KB32_PLAFO|nr:hypothetical protein PFFVO_00336 [Plasmodium falciparum Vietnam Oak-Knoll (FVO)]ETW38920.1 hypothetical protein PFTANZ_00397 [Plasmodium falciparum Tanzania (2000708)]ETW45444.1 hypothetical protein PFNF135_00365 [Plasmodium falciparum NF135/5.C10]ETW57653.1 hypothetical protein PFUGPA_00346 [Plasmodium falciparum Palo Alto/Uganda]ETW63781.1 hypothetical protein PFMC_00340 [Plasmodium falciparum CAMP/Malaysia]EUR81533.1 hypothetical protein PFBG_00203 [Plasmodium falciparum 7G8]EUT80019.1 
MYINILNIIVKKKNNKINIYIDIIIFPFERFEELLLKYFEINFEICYNNNFKSVHITNKCQSIYITALIFNNCFFVLYLFIRGVNIYSYPSYYYYYYDFIYEGDTQKSVKKIMKSISCCIIRYFFLRTTKKDEYIQK